MRSDGSLKQRERGDAPRSGPLPKLFDLIREMHEVSRDLYDPGDDQLALDEAKVDDLRTMVEELRCWSITEVGDLYLTSGGCVVLDKGYGEYFTEADEVLFSRDELHTGVPADRFLERVREATEKREENGLKSQEDDSSGN